MPDINQSSDKGFPLETGMGVFVSYRFGKYPNTRRFVVEKVGRRWATLTPRFIYPIDRFTGRSKPNYAGLDTGYVAIRDWSVEP